MAENIQLQRPSSGQSSVVPVGPDARLEFAFDQGDANFSKDGQDFVLTFDDGATLRIQGFYDNFGDNAQPPTLVVQGQELPGDQFLAALNNPDLMPAAGPGAGPPMGGGSYEDALLSGVGGVDRLDKLEFDGWGRNTEVTEEYRSLIAEPETPGGTFGLEGNSYDMNGIFVASGMYEDWRPSQHEDDYDTKLYGKLDFSFTPTGTTVVDGIHLSGFDAGTIIVIGAPVFNEKGELVNGVTVTGPDQVFDFTRANFDSDGVYVLPPPNSDADMNISVALDLRATSSGLIGGMSGSFTIVVDAVADKPHVQEAGFDNMGLEGSVAEVKDSHEKFEGGYHKVDQDVDATATMTVSVPFHTTVKFGDYEDNSEAHYVLIEVPAVPAGASWSCPEASGTITGPDGKEYFQIPVNNADIAKGNGEIAVDVHLTATGTVEDMKNAAINLNVGAMAEEQYKDGEFDFTNNVSFDWKEDGADFTLDVVDGGLTITAGWASEGNNDAKHLGSADSGDYFIAPGSDAAQYAEATGETALHANTGAPITIDVGVGHEGTPETITSVTFSYDASEGYLYYNGDPLIPGADGKVTITIDPSSPASHLDLTYRPNMGSYSDQDVNIHYTVNVKNEAGVTGSYTGDFTVVVDAVADMPINTGTTGLDYAYQGTGGYEAATAGSIVSFTVKGDFPDTGGSENHFLLVQAPPEGSHLTLCDANGNNISDQYGTIKIGSDTFYKIPVPGDQASTSAQVYFKVDDERGGAKDAAYPIKTGALAEVIDGEISTSPHDDMGREYDYGNNQAWKINDPVNIKVDYLDAGGAGSAKAMYEDNMPDQHLGLLTTGSATDGTLALNIAYAAGTGDTKTVMTGEADGNIRITFTYDGDESTTELHFTMNGEDYYAVRTESTHEFVLKIPAADLADAQKGTDGQLKYDPPANDDHDLKDITFSTWVKNEATGETKHLENIGAGALIVDAVADKPTYASQDATKPAEVEYALNGEPQDSATWGSVIEFPVKNVTFHDIADGSEKHYVLVEKLDGWSGDYSTVVYNGVTYFVIDVNAAIAQALTEGDGAYGGIRVAITYDDYGQPHAGVSLEVHLALPERDEGELRADDGNITLKAGGLAVEGALSEADENGHRGNVTDNRHGSDTGEITPDNNVADTLQGVSIAVNVVTSEPKVSITDNRIYENLTPEAHKGDETQAAYSNGAAITVSGLAEDETAVITFTFDFVKGGATEGAFDSAPKYNDPDSPDYDVMRLELVDGEGQVIGTYYIEWDGTNWTCTVPNVAGGSDAELIFKPGYNYNSADIGITYEMTVTDPASGDQIHWKTGDTPELPGLTVVVDAVAQQPLLDDTSAAYDRTGGEDAFVSGGKVDLGIKVEYRDVEDNSEKHYVLVEAKVGWQAPDATLTIIDENNVAHEVTATWAMQMIDGMMYWKAEVPNEYIRDWGTAGEYGDGMLQMHVAMQSPSGVSGHMDFRVGGGAYEEKGQVDGEIRWDNNSAFAFNEVGIDFNKAGTFGLNVSNPVYENDTPNAHGGALPQVAVDPGGHAGGTTLTVTVTHGGDVITDFHFTNYDTSKGTIYFNGEPINLDGTIPGNPTLTGGETFTFIPAHNWSDADVNLRFQGTITDPHSGDTHTYTPSAQIIVDAVAQKPESVSLAEDGQTVDISYGAAGDKDSFTLNVSAKFEDFTDTSESHYVLVEAKPNMSIPGSVGTFSVRDTDPDSSTYGEYITYWKVPVDNAKINPDGTVTVQVTVVIEGVIPGHGIDTNMRVGALAAEETPRDGELTFHNNWAYSEGGGVHVYLGGGEGGGSGFWADVAYENDRPDSHKGDESSTGGAYVTFGQGEGDTVHVTWDKDRGYFRDEAGKEYKGGDVDLDGKDGPFYFVPEGHGDEDVKVQFTVTDPDGNARGGTGTIVVDAVANKPSWGTDADGNPLHDDYTMNSVVDYGKDGEGKPWTAMGDKGNQGNEGQVTIHVTGSFADNDGSEKHYALVEAQPGFTVTNPGAEMIYLDGRAYWRVEMAKDADGNYLEMDGKQYADVVIKVDTPKAIGSGGHDLGTGLLAEETNYGTTGNLEERTDNNVSWTLGGNAHIDVSFVNSEASVSMNTQFYERGSDDAPGIPLTIAAATKDDTDEFVGMTINASGAGKFVVEDLGAPEGSWHLEGDGKLVITDINAIGMINVSFVPEVHSDQDIHFTWSATFRDTLSGDVASYGGSPTVIVDAVANAPTIEGTRVESDGGALAAYAGEGTKVTTTLHFDDQSGREIHYAVLQEGQYVGSQDNVWLCDGVYINGEPVTPDKIITVFDQSGKPYYAVVVPDSALDANGNVDITWHVTAPNITHDLDANLKMGGISVEPTTGADGDKELTLANNWAENVQDVPVKIGQFDTVTVKLGQAGELVENDVATGIALHLDAPAAGTNEIITKTDFTFSQDGAEDGDVIGTIWYKGNPYEVVADAEGKGSVTINFVEDFGEAYDPDAPFYFTATDEAGNSRHNSNPISVDTDSTVKDVNLGEERDGFAGHQNLHVTAVADAPADVAGTDPDAPVGAGQEVTVTVSAQFVDVDGSEKHYVLVEAKDGWECATDHVLFKDTDGTTYFAVEVDGSLANVEDFPVVLITPKDYVLGDHTEQLAVGGLAREMADGSLNADGFTHGGTVDVVIHDTANLTLVSNNEGGVAEGGTMSFTLALANDAGQAFAPGESITVTLQLSGVDAATAAQLPSGWTTADGGLTYTCDVTLAAGATFVDIPIDVAKDGVLGQTVAESFNLKVVGWDVGATGNIDASALENASYDVPITDGDAGYLTLVNNSGGEITEGAAMSFTLKLTDAENGEGKDLKAVDDVTVTVKLSGIDDPATAADLNLAGWEPQGDGTYILVVNLEHGQSSVNLDIPTVADNLLEHNEGVRIEVIGSNTAGLNITVPEASHDITILDGDSAHFAMEPSAATLESGDMLSFDLRLLNSQNDPMTAAMPLMVAFVVDYAAGGFSVPDSMLGPENAVSDKYGNSLAWSNGDDGEYILTATLAAGQDSVHVSFEALHPKGEDGVIDANQTLNLSLHGVSNVPGLAAEIDTGDALPLSAGNHVEFTIVDTDYALVAPHGVTHAEADGMELVQVAGGNYDGSGVEQGQVVLGTSDTDTIYATQGNDILIGGGSSGDTFVWNNNNMGQDSNALDVIKDFSTDDTLRFSELFGGHQHALDNLLLYNHHGTTTCTGNAENGFFEVTGHGATIQLNVVDAVATLSVSYQDHHSGDTYMQNVRLESLNMDPYTSGGELDAQAVAQMLSEIIKVGGSA